MTADGSVNHKQLSSPNHKPEAGQGSLRDAARHNTDKHNDQQPADNLRADNTRVAGRVLFQRANGGDLRHLMTKEAPNRPQCESLKISITKG